MLSIIKKQLFYLEELFFLSLLQAMEGYTLYALIYLKPPSIFLNL